MREIITDALVLAKEASGEFDQRVTLFTEGVGLVSAKVTSGRKITSKLSPHLEPFGFAAVRLVPGRGERNGRSAYHVADALERGRLSPPVISVFGIVRALLEEGVPDPELWHLFTRGQATPRAALRILGYDAASASCASCGTGAPGYFFFSELRYRCAACLPPKSERGAYVEVHG